MKKGPRLAGLPSVSARLRVVLLAVNALALPVLGFLDAPLLVRSHAPVGSRARLGPVDPRLTALELRGLAVGELPRLDALLDALLLVHVALNRSEERRVGKG